MSFGNLTDPDVREILTLPEFEWFRFSIGSSGQLVTRSAVARDGVLSRATVVVSVYAKPLHIQGDGKRDRIGGVAHHCVVRILTSQSSKICVRRQMVNI